MGKRKERRHAAMSNTGRRVKLDLFAEPSGDLGGSDVHDRVEREQIEPNELPNSPSSSGQRIENPLLLLGQYSDDEMDEDSDERTDDATADTSFANKKELVNGSVKDGHNNANTKSFTDTIKQIVEQQQTDASTPDFNAEVEGGDVTVSVSTVSDGLHMQTDSSIHESGTVSLDYHATRDVTSQWSMILHEESNRYYYWNTETGETSWEIPDVLAQTVGAYGTGVSESGAMVADESNVVSSVEPSHLQPVQNILSGSDFSTSLTSELGERNISEDLRVNDLATDDDQVECQIDSAVNYEPCGEKLAGSLNSDHVQANSDSELATDLPSRLLSQSEILLEKLRSLNKSDGNFHSHERISKYILEVEVRHSDVKALMLDTSHLLSFWLHTEKQLKRLEDSVNDEIYELAKSAVMDEITETNRSSPKEKEVSDGSKENDSEDSRREEKLDHSGKAPHSDKSADAGGDESPSHSQGDSGEQTDMTPSGEIFQKACSPAVEDIDMDVDMELEESVQMSPVPVIDDSDGKMISQTEPPNHHTDPSVGVIDITPVPPPPGEEWIPPPPPPSESEDVPPPPPDAYSEPIPTPPVSSDYLGLSYNLPQSYMQQSAEYTAQYGLPYPESNYPYISNPVAVAPNSRFYGHVDGSQVSLPQSGYYYETVPGTSEVASATPSTVEAYYDFKGAVPLFPVTSSAVESVHYNGVGSATYNTAELKSSNASIGVEPCSKANDSSEMASLGSASSQSTDAAGEVAGSSLLAKAQSKVKRTKKRTVTATSTLRSNKKVSSLVDKWKAAKEELNDSEEEEDDYVILDKKRQREIEEWKSRQIASGEAKDNANFQPLGGDWREKVKRRKERAGREAAAAASAGEEAQKKDEKQQQQQQQQRRPDLAKLSAKLPSGWQAYWDDSTKKVYYGNTITSKTSWTQPTS